LFTAAVRDNKFSLLVHVIHQVAPAGFPEVPPKNEQAMLIHAECSDSAGPEKGMRECKRLLATLDLGVGTYSRVFFLLFNYLFFLPY
jgi:hypothetical protein